MCLEEREQECSRVLWNKIDDHRLSAQFCLHNFLAASICHTHKCVRPLESPSERFNDLICVDVGSVVKLSMPEEEEMHD